MTETFPVMNGYIFSNGLGTVALGQLQALTGMMMGFLGRDVLQVYESAL